MIFNKPIISEEIVNTRIPYDLLEDDRYWLENNLPKIINGIINKLYFTSKNPLEEFTIGNLYLDGWKMSINVEPNANHVRYTLTLNRINESIGFAPIIVSHYITGNTYIHIQRLEDYIINCLRTKYFRRTEQEYLN